MIQIWLGFVGIQQNLLRCQCDISKTINILFVIFYRKFVLLHILNYTCELGFLYTFYSWILWYICCIILWPNNCNFIDLVIVIPHCLYENNIAPWQVVQFSRGYDITYCTEGLKPLGDSAFQSCRFFCLISLR